MSPKSAVRCETSRCIETIEKFGEQYHRVVDSDYGDKETVCEGCGAKHQDGTWTKTCKECKAHPESLHGLFVPHLCPACYEKHRQNDQKCSRCRQPHIDCCC
jgi:hypothetical protein